MPLTPQLIGRTSFVSVTSATIGTGNIAIGTRIMIAVCLNASWWDDVTDTQSDDTVDPPVGNMYLQRLGTVHPNGTVGAWFLTCDSTVARLRPADNLILTRAAGMSGSFGAFSASGVASGVMDSGSAGAGTSISPLVAIDDVPANDYLIGIVAVAGPSADGFTQDPDYTNPGNFNVQNTTDFSVYCGLRQHAAAGQASYQPTLGVARDWCALLMAIKP